MKRALPIVILLGACAREAPDAPLDRLDLPTGLALAPEGRWLFVTNGNWDRVRANSSLIALDLAILDGAVADASAEGICRPDASESGPLRCDARVLIEGGVRLGSGAGNIAIDRPSGEGGPLRLLVPTRIESSLAWVDVAGYAGDELSFDCGQDELARCNRFHRIRLDDDPARLSIDEQGFRFAYLPHLLGGRLSMFSLDGIGGPARVDVEIEFFREDGLFDSGLAGGFAVAQRACSVADDNAPVDSAECTRPFLVASQRYWWGVREFQVAPGLDVIVGGREKTVLGPNLEAAEPRPLMGGLGFEDPDRGERLLIVHTTPPALSRVDTSLDEFDEPKMEVLATVGLCANPNVLVVHRPASGMDLALVSCYGDDQVAAVDLGLFAVVATIDVGRGPNELLIDPEREWLWVANTVDSSLSIIDLSSSPTYLRELARVE